VKQSVADRSERRGPRPGQRAAPIKDPWQERRGQAQTEPEPRAPSAQQPQRATFTLDRALPDADLPVRVGKGTVLPTALVPVSPLDVARAAALTCGPAPALDRLRGLPRAGTLA
jgi:hypothetical protein